MDKLNDFINTLNGILFSEVVVFALLFTGILFTVWSVFGQYRALTHGVSVVRGKYDDKNDPGAINHFQALSTALSATVGLGNIAGVALAVALGGPGAILWMWVIGVVGMALKMTEVTQSMLYRNTDNPDEPHGGPMFVAREGFKKWGMGTVGSVVGGIFVVTLLISALTGGNMFQAWNVADIAENYFDVPQIATGAILAVVVGMVIIGGIKRIGSVAGRIVPFMCVIYLLAALYVLAMHLGEIPAMLGLIVKSGLPPFLGGESASAGGAFLGGSFGYAAMWGIKRALFSSEAGQGSSPIAHSAAKTDEPVREAVVAGLEPFIDTLVVCTLTALVILSSGAYDREAEAYFATADDVRVVATDDGKWTIKMDALPDRTQAARDTLMIDEGEAGWRDGDKVFTIVKGDQDDSIGHDLIRVTGVVERGDGDDGTLTINWSTFEATAPAIHITEEGMMPGIYGDYAGASLTAHAFDRETPGLGKWLVSLAALLFALSTMISWSYYGEQGIVYLFGKLGDGTTSMAVFLYKIIYCLLIFMTTVAAMPMFGPDKKALIGTDVELDMWTTLGLGVMLVANIPIMLIFGSQAMAAYHSYIGKLKRGELDSHDAPSITDVVEGHDVE